MTCIHTCNFVLSTAFLHRSHMSPNSVPLGPCLLISRFQLFCTLISAACEKVRLFRPITKPCHNLVGRQGWDFGQGSLWLPAWYTIRIMHILPEMGPLVFDDSTLSIEFHQFSVQRSLKVVGGCCGSITPTANCRWLGSGDSEAMRTKIIPQHGWSNLGKMR